MSNSQILTPSEADALSLDATAESKAERAKRKAIQKVDEVTTKAGDRAHQAASRVRDADLTERTAGQMDAVGDYLKSANYDELVKDVTGVVKRHPVPSLLAAAGVGFLLGRMTS